MEMTVDLYMHPLSWRVLRRETDCAIGPVPVTKQPIYKYIVPLLRRHEYISTAQYRELHDKQFLHGQILIPMHDCKDYGCHLHYRSMLMVSSILYNQERDRLCQLVMAAHCTTGVATDKAIEFYLDKYDLSFEEMNLPRLKKHYQRHFTKLELDYLSDLQHLKSLKRNKQ